MAVRIVVDALMACLFVLVMATALVAEAPHEFIGLALVVLVVAHLIFNRRWFAALARGRWTALRIVQAVAMLGLVACIIGQAMSAAILSKHALAFLPALSGAAWARSVHMLCSYWSFIFALVHDRSLESGTLLTLTPSARGDSFAAARPRFWHNQPSI